MVCLIIMFVDGSRLGSMSLGAGLLSKGISIIWTNGPIGNVRNLVETNIVSWEVRTQCNSVVCSAAFWKMTWWSLKAEWLQEPSGEDVQPGRMNRVINSWSVEVIAPFGSAFSRFY